MPPPNQYAEYPRNTFQPSGEFDRPPGVYFDAISDAWTIVTRDFGTWLGLTVASIALLIVMQGPFIALSMYLQNGGSFDLMNKPAELNLPMYLMGMLANIAGGALQFVVQAGLLNTALKKIRGQDISIGDIFSGFGSFGSLMVAGFITNLLISLGFAACIVPGVFLLGAVAFVPLLIVDKGMSIGGAIGESFRVLGSQAWLLALFIILLIILLALGSLCCVGFFVTFPIYIVGIALHYNYFYQVRPMTYAPPAV